MSRHKRVVPLPRLFTAQCTPTCIHAERVYAAQLTTISASFHNASTHVQREDVYAYAAIIVCPARIPSSSRSPLSNILPCKSNYMLVSNAQAKIIPVLVRHSSSRLVKSSLVDFVNASHWLSNRRGRGNVHREKKLDFSLDLSRIQRVCTIKRILKCLNIILFYCNFVFLYFYIFYLKVTQLFVFNCEFHLIRL